MNIITVIFIAFALSMDAFAVSMCIGTSSEQNKTKIALKAGFFFGLFQAVMPLFGWAAGYLIREIIENFYYWVAFGLLLIIGLRMIIEAVKNKSDCRKFNTDNVWVMLSLSIATSLDALAVGLSLAFIRMPVLLAVAIIGIITFWMSFLGIHIGKKLSGILGNKAEIAGGLVLIGIGIKILIEHL